MSSPTSNEVYAQISVTTKAIEKMHGMLLDRLRDNDPNGTVYMQLVRDLVDVELKLLHLSTMPMTDAHR